MNENNSYVNYKMKSYQTNDKISNDQEKYRYDGSRKLHFQIKEII